MESSWKDKPITIEELRDQIDLIDDQILGLLNERGKLVLQLGEIKRAQNLPIYVPSRENRILERLRNNNRGPLDDASVTRLYQKIIDESRRLEDGGG